MVIRTLELLNFRNYDSLVLEFDEKTNILYGDNAQGKTNILEAIYICSSTKSHKGSKDKEVIQLGKDESHIRMILEKREHVYKIDLHLKNSKAKGMAIDGVPIRKSTELIGLSNVVFFSPEDLAIIKNGPSERRRFIDSELCQINKLYLHNLIRYKKTLEQRNQVLRQIEGKPDWMETLTVWDEKLVEYGTQVLMGRRDFLREVNDVVPSIHRQLTGSKEELFLQYEPHVVEGDFMERLEKSRTRDLQTKTTNVGPHRDDVAFLIDGKDGRKFGSQGQQRTAALSLKLSEIEIIRRHTGDDPILLLDDVLSELDGSRQTYLLNEIEDIQTILTCTGLEEFVRRNRTAKKVYQVVDGRVCHI